MDDVAWDNQATLYRVSAVGGEDDADEQEVARGTVYELVGEVLEMPADRQHGLLIRTATAADVAEYDADAIRELAARPEFTGGA